MSRQENCRALRDLDAANERDAKLPMHQERIPSTGRQSSQCERGEETVLAEFPRGQDGNEKLRITLASFKGYPFIGARIWFKGVDGTWRPTQKGVTFRVKELGEVRAALDRAESLLGNG